MTVLDAKQDHNLSEEVQSAFPLPVDNGGEAPEILVTSEFWYHVADMLTNLCRSSEKVLVDELLSLIY